MSLSLERVAEVNRMQGRVDQALEDLERARRLREDLLDLPSDFGSPEEDFAVVLRRLGDLHRERGDLELALQQFVKARATMERIVGSDTQNPDWQRELAAAAERVGTVSLALERYDESSAAFEYARGTLETLVSQDPSNVGWQRDLAIYVEAAGDIREVQGELDQARYEYDHALRLKQSLLRANPADVALHQGVSAVLKKLGDLDRAAGSYDEAEMRYEQALAIIRAVNLIEPQRAVYQWDVGYTSDQLASLFAQRGEWDKTLRRRAEALVAYLRALAIDSGHTLALSSLQDAAMALRDNLGRVSNTHARQTIDRLVFKSVELGEDYPEAARQLRTIAAALAFDVLHDPTIAMPIIDGLAEDFPDDPQVLGNRAELALALWRDPDGVRTAIERFLEHAMTPSMRVGGCAFAVAAAVLHGDRPMMEMASDNLLSALSDLGGQPHGWSFTGTVAALATREHPAKERLVLLFETLESENPEDLRHSIEPLLSELGDQ
jgi:tetratricopeptide (TPR) repeat protein